MCCSSECVLVSSYILGLAWVEEELNEVKYCTSFAIFFEGVPVHLCEVLMAI